MERYLELSEDGQPDEAKEWEDFEGPQEIPNIYDLCQECGADTEGFSILVGNKILCHKCARDFEVQRK